MHNSFSGQTLFETWSSLASYNVIWTALPPFFMGIFDQYLNARVIDSYPQLYRLGQRDTFYNNRIFISSIATTLLHSLIIFYCWKWSLGDSVVHQNGRTVDIWAFGVMVYATDLVAVSLKACLYVNSWVSFTAYVLAGSVVAYMVIFPIYAIVFKDNIRLDPFWVYLRNFITST
jgi:phospholipid-transporting ATPase